jgi:hypothetical protein
MATGSGPVRPCALVGEGPPSFFRRPLAHPADLKKVYVKNFFLKKSTKSLMSVFFRCFWFYLFSGISAMGVQRDYKNLFTLYKNIMSKRFYKKLTKIQKPNFPGFFYQRF